MDGVTIDFEASCLPRHGRSFPIELGLCGPNGTISWLIRPHPTWQDWDWTDEAFGVHGISRAQLYDQGIPPDRVLSEALEVIGRHRVIADSLLDSQWWKTLCQAVGPYQTMPTAHDASLIRVDHVGSLFAELGANHQQIMAAQRHADRLCPQRHRAGADARWLWTVLSALARDCAHDIVPNEPMKLSEALG